MSVVVNTFLFEKNFIYLNKLKIGNRIVFLANTFIPN